MTQLQSFLLQFGEVNGLLILGIILLFLWVGKLNARNHKQHQSHLRDKQGEIDRLVAFNRELQDRYLRELDRGHEQRFGRTNDDEAKQ